MEGMILYTGILTTISLRWQTTGIAPSLAFGRLWPRAKGFVKLTVILVRAYYRLIPLALNDLLVTGHTPARILIVHDA